MSQAAVQRDLDYVKSREQQRIPGYGGHAPMVKSQCGITYGNATKVSYLKTEIDRSNTSRISSLYREKKNSDPRELAVVYLKRSEESSRPNSGNNRSQWSRPPYTLSHTGKRREEVFAFNQMSQLHRKHYQDPTGTVQPVPSFTHRRAASAPPTIFVAPTIQEMTRHPNEPQETAHQKVVSYMKYSKIPFNELKHPKYIYRQPSAREKRVRDVYFERR